ncbi:MAG: DedA family protein [Candidatus Woesearchaeota archaeon]
MIETLTKLIDFALHIDKHLSILVQNYGAGVYFILFFIVFLETGLVITPFLPGDSLLFISGTFAAAGIMDIVVLFFVFTIAGILGDGFNFWLASNFGVKLFEKSKLFKKEHLERTRKFYKLHGGKTIVIARFLPIIRTFAPFVAGIAKMDYKKFLFYNIIGGILWVSTFLFVGYLFGNIPIVQQNLMLVTLVIIVVSLIPAFVEFLRHRMRKK